MPNNNNLIKALLALFAIVASFSVVYGIIQYADLRDTTNELMVYKDHVSHACMVIEMLHYDIDKLCEDFDPSNPERYIGTPEWSKYVNCGQSTKDFTYRNFTCNGEACVFGKNIPPYCAEVNGG